MLVEDINLSESDIQSLSNRDAIASFFTTLGYQVERLTQTPVALGITNETLIRHINHIEQIAVQDGELYIYLFEMKSIRVADRQALARTFRNATGEYLLVITADYSSLDFVLLERLEPRDSDGNPMLNKNVIIQQHVLSVDRRNPGRVAKRVLKRFTYTEELVIDQLDKLLSAYTVAKWSRPMFNNRALFADYFLEHRLPDLSEWKEPSQQIYNRLQSLFANIRSRLGNPTEEQTRERLLEPIFDILGFESPAPQSSGDTVQPDYVMTMPETGEVLAYVLTYRWNRYLDGRDTAVSFTGNGLDAQKYDDNPGARVVSLLAEDESPPYIIVTNGKLWRLFAKDAHSRATNYYEIDLEETLNDPDRDVSILYFWLFFRAQAFVPVDTSHDGEVRPMSFLDRVMAGSSDYAKELEKSLKNRVFEQIFPSFAEGFIRYRWGTDTPTQDELAQVYQATLTFLYRMMFLLYAEARDLLPIKEARGYAEISLKTMKDDIANRAGVVLDVAEEKLRLAYSPGSTELYDQLTRLFTVIDKGDNKLNVPNYNGGLFVTDPAVDDMSPDAVNARFLRDTKIPDRYLALGLDRLARDNGSRPGEGLVAIDYKSLGVRQLGSIYEGLLEFKLRVAPEKMAIIKGKRTEEVVPYKQTKKKDIITTGRGDNKQESTLAKGDVYLENTRQERKATGSYYTPDYIVKYIVQHTVGPVLDEKFEQITSRLRQAERDFAQWRKNNRGKPKQQSEDLFWEGEAMLQLAADVLDVKVLDPAMGSGHFLVEVVDYVTDRTLQFLDRFRYNPVQAQLRLVRESILENMDEQGVNIDEKRLTDVNLLKRQVLKRCVYGVDLNRMAVELAKVSLWLDAFTLGAPLSFLDHHLRWGNSLIGTMARDADNELQGRGAGQTLSLWGGPFVGLLQAAEVMRGVSALADATIEEAHRSARLFKQFEEAAKPYKQLLDIFVIQHFGVKKAAEFLTLYGADVMDARRDEVDKAYQEVLDHREELYQQYRFFHWDLEFPEVFIDLGKAEWKENAGFDAIVGNPPYDELSEEDLGRPVYENQFFENAPYAQVAIGRRVNVYRVFMARTLSIMRHQGQNGFVVPMSIMADSFTFPLREKLLEDNQLITIQVFPQKDDPNRRVFTDAKLSTCIYIIKKQKPSNTFSVATHVGKDILDDSPCYEALPSDIKIFDEANLSIPLISETGWSLCLRMAKDLKRLGDEVQAITGELMINSKIKPYISESPNDFEIIRGAYVNPYWLSDTASQGDTLYLLKDKYLADHPNSDKAQHHKVDRVVYQRYAAIDMYRRLIATIVPAGNFCSHTVGYLMSDAFDSYFILAIMNSKLLDWRFNLTSTNNNINGYELEALPLPEINFTTPQERRDQLAEKGRRLYQRCLSEGHACVLEFVEHHLAQDETDVIHDLLAFLAQRMIDLNKEKQTEMTRFLTWLEAQIGAKVDDLSGKSYIQNYIGNYQKDEHEYSPDDLIDRLTGYGNPRKMSAKISNKALQAKIVTEYEASLEKLRPIKQQLKDTDELIDQVVYKLYGLTEDEIAIVDGRA